MPGSLTRAQLSASQTTATDDKFLECAEAARADYLVTGNVRRFPEFWKGTKIIAARPL